MSTYYVVYWRKIGGFSRACIERVENEGVGKGVVKNYGKLGYDVLLVEEYIYLRTMQKRYRIVKVGFYKYLKFFTYGIYKLGFMIAIILYLYYKFIYKP